MRFAPLAVRADLSEKSRASLMDENGWTYRLMAEELFREKRIDAAKLDAKTIGDPREYLYAEIYSEPENAAINVEAQLSDTEKYSSDAGVEQLHVNRQGYARIVLHLPPNRAAEFPKKINVGCFALSGGAEGVCRNVRLVN